MSSTETDSSSSADVFLNVPYDKAYEPVLLALTAALVALGRTPRLTFEVPDDGVGRIKRIIDLIRKCPVSFHDLSAVDLPPRFNMPFELGLACAVQHLGGKPRAKKHRYFILEAEPHRLDRHLSDLKGVDHKVHHGDPAAAIAAVLEVLDTPGYRPNAKEVFALYQAMSAAVPEVLKLHLKDKIFSVRVYGALVAIGWDLAAALGFHEV